MTKFNAIDLFSGCGGLSLGLEKSGFNILASVEIDKKVSETYSANHPTAEVFAEDIRKINAEIVFEKIGDKRIHLIAGCPPCQGFSKLTDKYKRFDERNNLPLEMARLVKEIKPDIVMMENVPGIAKKGKPILDKFIKILEEENYIVNWRILQAADFGVPQSRKRFVLIAGRGFEIKIPEGNPDKRKSLRQALKKNKKQAVTFEEAMKKGGPAKFNWNVVRNLEEISIRRLQAMGEGSGRTSLPEDLRPNCHKGSNKGFNNVYGRMTWDKISPTITSGCTSPSTGRFGHPSEDRTISVREAAMIQTFPLGYKFKTNQVGLACSMIGNAFPPKLAEILGKKCISHLN